MKYLFLFTISPVQTFIAQARKTKDLYNGSKLLTDLIKVAIEDMEPIFPKKGLDSYPNRFIAIVEKENNSEMKAFAEELKTKVLNKFESIALKIVKEKTKRDENDLSGNFLKQIRNHFQVHWVAIPFEENNYQKQFSEIEASLGAIKNIREFEQVEETGRKCSLCGERNLLFCANGNKIKLQLKPNWRLLSDIDSSKIKDFNNSIIEIREPFDSSEGLCAVCFTKRFYQESSFPSTAEIALMETITSLEKNTDAKTKVEKYIKIFDNDYQLFFEENLTSKYFEKQFIKADLKSAVEKYNHVKDEIKNAKLKLSPYYAVVMFDGDSMGKWLSGKELKPGVSLLEFQKVLTNALGEFADKARKIVKNPKGQIVFAGGEDFLAFVNLNHLFSVLKELRTEFDELVNKEIEKANFKKDNSSNLTFSAGIIISHYKMPLSEVLKWARELEKEAKKKYTDKDAFALAIIKHSGEINKTAFRWGDEKGLTNNLDVIAEITALLSKDIFSNTFIKSITTELLSVNDHKGLSFSVEILKTELKRLLTRSCKLTKGETEKTDEFKQRKKTIISETAEKISGLYSSNKNTEDFFSALNTAEFISRYLNRGKNEN